MWRIKHAIILSSDTVIYPSPFPTPHRYTTVPSPLQHHATTSISRCKARRCKLWKTGTIGQACAKHTSLPSLYSLPPFFLRRSLSRLPPSARFLSSFDHWSVRPAGVLCVIGANDHSISSLSPTAGLPALFCGLCGQPRTAARATCNVAPFQRRPMAKTEFKEKSWQSRCRRSFV